ncbi:MAG TPA: cytidine deaminase [Nitriliruptorales bacterium]|nr:cytidine deaminase [Nitriliruptorales bacterium]
MRVSRGGGETVDEADLLRRARAARERAYAPYSSFRVGAVVVTEDGHVAEGSNVENAAYGMATCAERVAIQQLIASGVRSPVVAVAVVGDGDDPCVPCGACRQVIFEFGPTAVVYASGDGGRPLVATIGDLLPHPFGPRRLAQGRDVGGVV